VISVCYTSARPALVPGRVQEWVAKAADVHSIEFVVTIDAALAASQGPLTRLPQTRVFVNRGRPCCVDGWNLAARKARGNILIQCSDDLHPPPRWDAEVRARLADGDRPAVLAISDGLTAGARFMPHAILTRRYYNQLGYLFHDAYWSMWSDNEFSAVAHRRNAVVEALDLQFTHSHGQIWDEVRTRHEGPAFHGTGQQVFLFRERNAFEPWSFATFTSEDEDSDGIYSPNWRARMARYWNASPRTAEHYLALHRESLENRTQTFGASGAATGVEALISAGPGRGAFLELLAAELARQGMPFLVDDRPGVPAGEKRNHLIARATAPYVTFLDDADWVAHNYAEAIGDALAGNGDGVDAILHDVLATVEGAPPKPTFFALDRAEADLADCRIRAPDASMVWRREVALREPFPPEGAMADADWPARMRPHLTRWGRVRGLLRFHERPSTG
jgi:hypothetical protein